MVTTTTKNNNFELPLVTKQQKTLNKQTCEKKIDQYNIPTDEMYISHTKCYAAADQVACDAFCFQQKTNTQHELQMKFQRELNPGCWR